MSKKKKVLKLAKPSENIPSFSGGLANIEAILYGFHFTRAWVGNFGSTAGKELEVPQCTAQV